MRFLASPKTLIRAETGALCAVCVQRMRVVGSDDAGRSRIEPVAGDEEIVLASSLVSAVSQEADWQGLEVLAPQRGFLEQGTGVAVLGESLVCAGGDLTGLDLASHAIGQGRRAAERIHAELRGLPLADSLAAPFTAVRANHFPPGERVAVPEVPVVERLAEASRESCHTISEELFLQEISRCFSCGLCNGCQLCWMYCGGQGFTRVASPKPGHYFAFSTAECTGCGKCIELCPTGFLGHAGTR
jgi:Pyruvate/2-oxoacid:ferredoxin oxidoreductase delta subunit